MTDSIDNIQERTAGAMLAASAKSGAMLAASTSMCSAVSAMSDLWYQDQVSLGTKRDSRQEVSSVALIVTRYPMTKYIRKTRREGSLLPPLDISDSRCWCKYHLVPPPSFFAKRLFSPIPLSSESTRDNLWRDNKSVALVGIELSPPGGGISSLSSNSSLSKRQKWVG